MGFIYGVTLSRFEEREENDSQKSEVGHNNVKDTGRTKFSCSFLKRMSGKQNVVAKIES